MLIEGSQSLFTSTVVTGGASQNLVALNAQRNGLFVSLDSGATASVYLLLWNGVGVAPTASATNFSICLSAGQAWNGLIGSVLWEGAVQVFSTAAGKIGVSEV